MNARERVIHRFYEAFRSGDAEAMCSCYHREIVFSDPVFGRLSGDEAKAMWRMLCARAKDLAVTFGSVTSVGSFGSAHWEARYSFSKTGRAVHNVIEASFEFRGDAIVRHRDRFSLWRWAGMALGPTGVLLGWTPPVRAAIRREARHGLESFLTGGRA